MTVNGVMFQSFHWYSKGDGHFWNMLAANAKGLSEAGFTAVWLPPAYKGLKGSSEVGYAVYDMYDLGEFDQKGTFRTKYGTKDEYISAIEALHQSNIQVYPDVVLNHRISGDNPEIINATPFNQGDRLNPAGPQTQIKSYTHFSFPGRKGRYSTFEWHWQHFDAVDYDENQPGRHGLIYLLEGKQFDNQVALEMGNFAYLMGCDIDFQSDAVREEIIRWGKWYLDITKADGFRLDAIKHISAWFFPEWHDILEKHAGKELFMVGEYWNGDLNTLCWYIDVIGGRFSVFDVPLHYNFHNAGRLGAQYDMRRILDNTLMRHRPLQAVTFVDNHDSQPLQSLESAVEPWFKPLAYAFILLRSEGYPCVFAADYYGAEYEDKGICITMPSHRFLLDKFLYARRNFAYGPQYDYIDHPNTIGWTRLGDEIHNSAMAVLMSNGSDGYKWMEAGKKNARFTDITGSLNEPVITNEYGWAEFRCRGGSVSVWVEG
jgi:alpha-amylase